MLFFALLGIANWRFILSFFPFWYFGHCLDYANGYSMHFGANPEMPIAWGVSTYVRLYNWLWFNNGCHAEHHFRPKIHWTEMKFFHAQCAAPNARRASVPSSHRIHWVFSIAICRPTHRSFVVLKNPFQGSGVEIIPRWTCAQPEVLGRLQSSPRADFQSFEATRLSEHRSAA